MTKGPPKRTILSSTNFLNPLRSKLLGQKYPETKKNVDIKYIWLQFWKKAATMVNDGDSYPPYDIPISYGGWRDIPIPPADELYHWPAA